MPFKCSPKPIGHIPLMNVMRGFLLEETRKVRIYVKIINGCFAAEWETLIVLLNIQTDYEVMYKK